MLSLYFLASCIKKFIYITRKHKVSIINSRISPYFTAVVLVYQGMVMEGKKEKDDDDEQEALEEATERKRIKH